MKKLLLVVSVWLQISLAAASTLPPAYPGSGGGGGGTPGGSAGQIQFNNGGTFGGLSVLPLANGGTGTVNGGSLTSALPTVSTAPLAVYATRLLMPAYTGPLFRIVNTSTAATLNISANLDGSPNVSGVSAFLNGTTQAYVDIIYDQTGSGNNATQTTVNLRPFFTLTNAINGVPSITFDGNQNNGYLTIPAGVTGSGTAVTTVDIASLESTNNGTVGMIGAAWNTPGSLSIILGRTNVDYLQVLTNTTFEKVTKALTRTQPQVTIVASGASNIVTYQDGTAQNLATNTTGTWAGGQIGNGGPSYAFYGEWYGRILYPAQLTVSDAAALNKSLNANFNILQSPTVQLVENGNSIVQGTKATLNINNLRQAEPNFNRRIAIANMGVYGQLLSTQYSSLAAFQAQYNSALQYNLMVLGEPTNDICGMATGSIVGVGTTDWTSYALPMIQGFISTGFTVLVPTILPRGWYTSCNTNSTSDTQMETERLTYNALVRSNAAVYGYTVLDYASIPLLSNPANATYYTSSDQTHPTTIGYTLMATLQTSVINTLLSSQQSYPFASPVFITPPVTVTASATPSVYLVTSSVQAITLNANAVPTISGLYSGQRVTFEICQPATGGPYSWTWPASVHGGMTIGTTASTCSIQTFDSLNGTSLVAESSGIANVAP